MVKRFTSTKPRSVRERFWEKVEKTETCWNWTASLYDGYGSLRVGHRMVKAHRLSLALHGVTLASGKEVDHLCRNRACVNPEHLEQVPKAVNVLRGEGTGAQFARRTHCKNGHDLTNPANLKKTKQTPGHRQCLLCHRMWTLKSRGQWYGAAA